MQYHQHSAAAAAAGQRRRHLANRNEMHVLWSIRRLRGAVFVSLKSRPLSLHPTAVCRRVFLKEPTKNSIQESYVFISVCLSVGWSSWRPPLSVTFHTEWPKFFFVSTEASRWLSTIQSFGTQLIVVVVIVVVAYVHCRFFPLPSEMF